MFSLLSQYSKKNSNINKEGSTPNLEATIGTNKLSNFNGERTQKEEKLRELRLSNLQKARESQGQRKEGGILDKKGEMGVFLHAQLNKKITETKKPIEEEENITPISTNNDNIIVKEEPIKSVTASTPKTSTTVEKTPYKRKSKMEKYKMWTKDSHFVSIDPPIALPDGERSRYKISFKYFDPIDKKTKKKTMNFGKQGVEYYVDHGNEDKNKIWLSKQRGYYTPFHKNFWVNCILCSELSVLKAYNKTLSVLLV